MCGIGFYLNYHGTRNMPLTDIAKTFKSLETRGNDASGFYFERQEETNKQIIEVKRVFKAPCMATTLWNYVHDPKFDSDRSKKDSKEIQKYRLTGKEKLIILHTRAKTVGTEWSLYNNHPIHSKNFILVHNGNVYNDRLKSYKYQGEVDSEEILAYMESYGIEKGLEKTQGSLAIIFKRFKDNFLYIIRHNAPMDLLYFKKEKLLVGVSSDSHVTIPDTNIKALFQANIIKCELPPDTLYKIPLDKFKSEFVTKIKFTI